MIYSLLLCILPTKVARLLLPVGRWRIQYGASVGFSWVNVKYLTLRAGSRIGNFNYIHCEKISLKNNAHIYNMNIARGPFSIFMDNKAQIGNRNVFSRPPRGVSWGRSVLRIGNNSKITVGHKIDCTRSVKIGVNSIVAGLGSQLWTHGYVHEPSGTRFRVDGPINIGDNVYIGSACVINAGAYVGNCVTVGSHCCISKSLLSPGLYVSSPIRHVDWNIEHMMTTLRPVKDSSLSERVYVKNPNVFEYKNDDSFPPTI
jgi:acetyltransferase-like isoleucine patch superfamily enzyme